MKLRYFSLTEAEALIPQVRQRMETCVETKMLIEKKVESWRKRQSKMSETDAVLLKSQLEFLSIQLEKQLGELTALGCVPKDIDAGLVDFPARISGHEGYLCWKMGEEKIQFWHGLNEGFSGRKKLPKGMDKNDC